MFNYAPDHYFDELAAALERAVAEGCASHGIAACVALAEGLEVAERVFEPQEQDPEPIVRPSGERRRIH